MKLVAGLSVVFLTAGAMAQSTSTSASSNSTPAATAAGQPATSTASLPTLVKEAAPRKIKADYLNEINWDLNRAKDGDGTMVSYNQLGLSYKATSNLSLAARMQFQTGYVVKDEVKKNCTTQNCTQEGTLSDIQWNDPFVQASIPKVAEFGKMKLSNLTRIYLPFGEVSQKETKAQGVWRNVLTLEQPVNDRVTLATVFFSQLYNQSQSANLNVATKKDVYTGNRLAYEILYQNVSVQMGKHVSFGQDLGVVGDWKHGYAAGGVVSSRQFRSYLDTSISTDAIKNVTLTLGVNNESPFADSKDASFAERNWQAYRLDESNWYFLLTASI